MINIPQGFHIGSTEPVDFRLILSTDEMLTINDDAMPDVYLLYVKKMVISIYTIKQIHLMK